MPTICPGRPIPIAALCTARHTPWLAPRAVAPPENHSPAMQQAQSGLAALRGSIVALATPFRRGHIDDASFSRLCLRQARRGTAALVVAGSTGEGPSLSLTEHARLIAIACEAVSGAIPVIAGVCAPATDPAMALGLSARRHGAAGLLCSPPPYLRPTQEGIAAHVRAVAHAADLPVMLYDVPSRVGTAVADATVARLFEHGLIFALKDAAGDLTRPQRLAALCGPDLRQFSGEDATALAHRLLGGHGCVSVTANLVPALGAAMHRACDGGTAQIAEGLEAKLAPLHRALFLESNPIPLKAALALLRLGTGELRLPLTRAAPETLAAIEACLPNLLRLEETASRPAAMPSTGRIMEGACGIRAA